MSIDVIWTAVHPEAVPPTKAYDDDAGWDLTAVEGTEIAPGGTVLVPTGIAIATPPGWWARIVGRSSTWRVKGLLTIEGVIDAGFRGELFVGVYNPSITRRVDIAAGERIGQLIFLPVPTVRWSERKLLPPSERGENGFGSTG